MRDKLEGHKRAVIALAYSPDGKTLISSGGNWNQTGKFGEAKSWDLETGKERWSATGEFWRRLGCGLLARWQDRRRQLLGRECSPLGRGHRQRVNDAEGPHQSCDLGGVHAQRKNVASTSSDGTTRFWDTATGKEKAVLKGHTGAVQRLVFSPVGAGLATTGNDGTIRIWQLVK